jgi:NADH dehydrogenase FAD-containing subunit
MLDPNESRDTPRRDHWLTAFQNSHFYWNLASVRAIIPGLIKDEDIFKPLESALSRYPSTSYELLIGTATAADFDAKTVDVTVSTDNSRRTLTYDHLVLATGSRCPEPTSPWKASGSYEEVLEHLHQTAKKAKAAKHIVVGGAGGTGVEVAGELAYEWGKTKEIILLSADDKVLGGDVTASAAANELKKLNVSIKYGARVDSTSTNSESGKTEVKLANGEVIATDLYLSTIGVVPNTEYVPAKYLAGKDNYRTVVVDEYLRVKETKDVWACGDVVSKPRAGFFITQKQAVSVAKNIEAALAGKEPAVAKGPPVDIFACAVGRGRGAGRMGSVKLPSFAVWLAKGRTLAVQMVPGYIDGSVA